MGLIIIAAVVFVGVVALLVWRYISRRNDRRRQEEDSKR